MILGRNLQAALLGGTAFVGIVLSVPLIALFVTPAGLPGAAMFLAVSAPFGLVFAAAATAALGLLRLILTPERDLTAIGAARYRYEGAIAGIAALTLPLMVFAASERDPWAFGTLPLGVVAGWIAAAVQKGHLRKGSRLPSTARDEGDYGRA